MQNFCVSVYMYMHYALPLQILIFYLNFIRNDTEQNSCFVCTENVLVNPLVRCTCMWVNKVKCSIIPNMQQCNQYCHTSSEKLLTIIRVAGFLHIKQL